SRGHRDQLLSVIETIGPEVDEEQRRKPQAIEKCALLTESARLSSALPPLATRAPAIRRAIFLWVPLTAPDSPRVPDAVQRPRVRASRGPRINSTKWSGAPLIGDRQELSP